MLAVNVAAWIEFEAMLDPFEAESAAARKALNRHVKRIGDAVRLRLVRFPEYALIGGGVGARPAWRRDQLLDIRSAIGSASRVSSSKWAASERQ